MPQGTLSMFRDTNGCHKEELLAPGAEARDAFKCPTMHTTAPDTMIIQPKMSIAPMLRNPIFTNEMKIFDFPKKLCSTGPISRIPQE